MKTAVQNPITPVRVDERRAIDIHPGDTVRVWQKMQDEKGKTRLQAFEGLVLARKHGSEAGATFTVRRMIDGVGVEKIFPLYSPLIDKIEITKRATVRRSKLYYIRDKAASQIRRQMRRMSQVEISTSSESEVPAEEEMAAIENDPETPTIPADEAIGEKSTEERSTEEKESQSEEETKTG